PPMLASFSIQPVPPDSAKLAAGIVVYHITSPLVARAADADGVALDLPVAFRSSDPSIATVDRHTGLVDGRQPGTVTFSASTTAFGVTKTDALPYRVGWPLFRNVDVIRVASAGLGGLVPAVVPSEFTVGTGAIVFWNMDSTTTANLGTVDVT